MVRRRVVLLLSLAVAVAGFSGWAAEDAGLSGTVGVEAVLLPGFSTDVRLDLDWQVDGWSVGSAAEISVFPAFGASWTGSVDYSFGRFGLGGAVAVDVYPFAFGVFDLHADVSLLDLAEDGFELSADASLLSEIYPVFGNVLSLDVDASYGDFSLWSNFDLTVPAFGASVLVGGEVRLLDLDLDGGSLTAGLGASAVVVPALDAGMWFDAELDLGGVVVTSATDFALTPFGLTEQRFEVEIGFDGFSIYAWGSFTGAGDLTAGIGATYDFP